MPSSNGDGIFGLKLYLTWLTFLCVTRALCGFFY